MGFTQRIAPLLVKRQSGRLIKKPIGFLRRSNIWLLQRSSKLTPVVRKSSPALGMSLVAYWQNFTSPIKALSKVQDPQLSKVEDADESKGNYALYGYDLFTPMWIMSGGGLCLALYGLSGVCLCFSILLIPWGLYCFKMFQVLLDPRNVKISTVKEYKIFSKEIPAYYGYAVNAIWMPFGVMFFLTHLALAGILMPTYILFDFGKFHWDLAQYSLTPWTTRYERDGKPLSFWQRGPLKYIGSWLENGPGSTESSPCSAENSPDSTDNSPASEKDTKKNR